MKEKCVQNVINLFIGLLTTRMMRLLKLNNMNLPRACILVRLAKASQAWTKRENEGVDAASQSKLEQTQALSLGYLTITF
jgi:hypothetical protein